MSAAWATPFCCILVIVLISTQAFAAEDTPDCSNQKTGKFYRTDDCIGWFMCVHGKAQRMPDCPNGLVFSLKAHNCVRRGGYYDDCKPAITGKCTGKQDGTIIPNEDNCTGWYMCVFGGATKMPDCGQGMVFSRENVTCVLQGGDYDDCTSPVR